MKDHEIRELVNQLRDVAIKYHGADQLREQIARVVRVHMLQAGTLTNEDTKQAGNSPVIPEGWQVEAEKLAEMYGMSFVLFRHGEAPQCADPTKVVISFTDKGLGHDTEPQSAPQNIPEIIPGWIPVRERMPEVEGHYLVWASASRIDGYCDHLAIATYQGREWGNEFNWLVTHWMPLPAAPQEVK